jgi:hypothetical protein
VVDNRSLEQRAALVVHGVAAVEPAVSVTLLADRDDPRRRAAKVGTTELDR